MAECYISSNPFYSATMLWSATEQYRLGSRNADVACTFSAWQCHTTSFKRFHNLSTVSSDNSQSIASKVVIEDGKNGGGTSVGKLVSIIRMISSLKRGEYVRNVLIHQEFLELL